MTDRKVALVTGASSGIGASTARVLAARDVAVVVNYLHGEERAKNVVSSIVTHGGQAVPFQADVTQDKQVRAMVEMAESALGPIDILVLNATGIYGHQVEVAPVSAISADYAEWMLQQQLRSIFHPVQAVVPGMLNRGAGCVIAVSAALARSPSPGFAALAMAKAALEAAVKTLAQELGPHGVRVNAVSPSFILTPSTEQTPEPVRAAVAERAAIRRIGLPGDVAETIAFLASDQADYLTGVSIPVDGGTP